MKTIQAITVCALACASWACAFDARATSTYAEAYGAVAGLPVDFHSDTSFAGASAGAGAAIVLGNASISSGASSSMGVLRTETAAFASAPTTVNGSARADWNSGFLITASGYDSSDTGVVFGSVAVSGGLMTDCNGSCSAVASVVANLAVSGNTGFNGGGIKMQGGGRLIDGNAIEGLESFTLNYSVPFTFGRPIDVSLRLEVTSLVSTGSVGVGHANASYAHSMTWLGISEVRDRSGMLLTSFSALGTDTNFDFARPVPEPGTALLMSLGFIALFGRVWKMQERYTLRCARS